MWENLPGLKVAPYVNKCRPRLWPFVTVFIILVQVNTRDHYSQDSGPWIIVSKPLVSFRVSLITPLSLVTSIYSIIITHLSHAAQVGSEFYT